MTYIQHDRLPPSFGPADRVRTNCYGLFDHVGSADGNGMIYAKSRKYGCLCLVTPFQFSSGRPIENEGQVGIYPPWYVLQVLHSKLGEPYDLLNGNCEHANNEAHGLGHVSPQIDDLLLGLCIGAAIVVARAA